MILRGIELFLSLKRFSSLVPLLVLSNFFILSVLQMNVYNVVIVFFSCSWLVWFIACKSQRLVLNDY